MVLVFTSNRRSQNDLSMESLDKIYSSIFLWYCSHRMKLNFFDSSTVQVLSEQKVQVAQLSRCMVFLKNVNSIVERNPSG